MNTPAHLTAAGIEQAARARARFEIEAIANDLKLPVGEVEAIYTLLYSDLRQHARVVDFLPLLVARKVRLHYQRRTHLPAFDLPAFTQPRQH